MKDQDNDRTAANAYWQQVAAIHETQEGAETEQERPAETSEQRTNDAERAVRRSRDHELER